MMKLLFLVTPILSFALSYEVHFVGLRNQDALNAMREVSELVSLQYRPPASINSLKYRIASDIPALLKVLRAFAYYDASITSDIELGKDQLDVYLFIQPGKQYRLSSYEVYSGDCKHIAAIPHCAPLTPEEVGLELEKPALSVSLVNAELEVLSQLSRCGYPLAYIDKRRVLVDMKTKEVEAATCVQPGPLSKFGPITLFGLKEIRPRFIEKKIGWCEGEVYDSDLVAATQQRLLKTELFSSVLVAHGDQLDKAGELPMKMHLTEAKHRHFSLGAFYATVDGPGLSFAWTHRNVRGLGEILSAKGDFSKRYAAGNCTYKKPDFFRLDQTYRALFEVVREKIRAYLAFTYRFAQYVERPITAKIAGSAGLKFEYIDIDKSANDGHFFLMGLPLFGRRDTSDSFLDPTHGYTLTYSITPYQSLKERNHRFAKQRLTMTFYIPIAKQKRLIFALRTQLGSIAGAKQRHIPLTKLFLGGSEDDLRGYRYNTVSPLDSERRPLGGRSAILASFEVRVRLMEKIGLVPFADFGTISASEIPRPNGRWRKSVGGGIRYYAFFGPLRFDIGFPLDKRRGIDPNFQIYASLGQTF